MATDVGRFYDRVQRWFTWFYSDQVSLGLHYGFWFPETKNRAEALTNPYREVREALQPSFGQEILDAGCGVGGASLWLAAHSPARFTGVTLSRVQQELAQRYARKRGRTDRVRFLVADYTALPVPDRTFDAAFTVESLCYSYPEPERTLGEFARVLKPGGRLAVLDSVLRRKPTNADEERRAQDFTEGYAMHGWCTADELVSATQAAGFTNITVTDRTQAIAPSVRDIANLARWAGLLVRAGSALGFISPEERRALDAARTQEPLYGSGLLGYVRITARRAK